MDTEPQNAKIPKKDLEKDTDLKMYILVNSDLKMGNGKKISQACHACLAITEVLCTEKRDLFRRYKASGQAKIALKATEAQMLELINTYGNQVKYVHDAGRTQVAANSLTAMAFYPMLASEAPDIVKTLKLI